ncbi:MAG: hypothetical protein KDD94_11380, partial [Calditrichaeota bacterium]|nr:hypothetical protein [Calditrichota bacterium]
GDVSAYKYLLERDGFKSISGSLNESEADEGHINFELHDIQHGIWKLTITAVNDGQSPIATGIADIEMLTGVVTIADVSYPINPFSLAINVSYGTQSGTANKFYVGDEKLRLYLINNKGFADLREPYVLKTDAESVQFLELHQQEFVATKT